MKRTVLVMTDRIGTLLVKFCLKKIEKVDPFDLTWNSYEDITFSLLFIQIQIQGIEKSTGWNRMVRKRMWMGNEIIRYIWFLAYSLVGTKTGKVLTF